MLRGYFGNSPWWNSYATYSQFMTPALRVPREEPTPCKSKRQPERLGHRWNCRRRVLANSLDCWLAVHAEGTSNWVSRGTPPKTFGLPREPPQASLLGS